MDKLKLIGVTGLAFFSTLASIITFESLMGFKSIWFALACALGVAFIYAMIALFREMLKEQEKKKLEAKPKKRKSRKCELSEACSENCTAQEVRKKKLAVFLDMILI